MNRSAQMRMLWDVADRLARARAIVANQISDDSIEWRELDRALVEAEQAAAKLYLVCGRPLRTERAMKGAALVALAMAVLAACSSGSSGTDESAVIESECDALGYTVAQYVAEELACDRFDREAYVSACEAAGEPAEQQVWACLDALDTIAECSVDAPSACQWWVAQ